MKSNELPKYKFRVGGVVSFFDEESKIRIGSIIRLYEDGTVYDVNVGGKTYAVKAEILHDEDNFYSKMNATEVGPIGLAPQDLGIEDKLILKSEVLEDIDLIKHVLWEIDIENPTIPEYIEFHDNVQKVMKVVDNVRLKYE